jgi:hypothetical protein
MKVTSTPRFSAIRAAKLVPAILSLILIFQPGFVRAQSVSGIVGDGGLTVGDDLGVDAQDAVPAGPPVPPTMQDLLLGVCTAHGYGIDCAKALLGMMWKESRYDAKAVGDHGKALGYFQIHYRMHHVTVSCAEDVTCSAEWTLAYMERNGYPKHPTWAIQCHNGCGVKNGYAASVLNHAKKFWDQPIAAGETIAIAVK